MGKGIAIAGIWIGTGVAVAFGHSYVNPTAVFLCALLATVIVAGIPFWRD
jgi:hypothetical protein